MEEEKLRDLESISSQTITSSSSSDSSEENDSIGHINSSGRKS